MTDDVILKENIATAEALTNALFQAANEFQIARGGIRNNARIQGVMDFTEVILTLTLIDEIGDDRPAKALDLIEEIVGNFKTSLINNYCSTRFKEMAKECITRGGSDVK